MLNLLFPAMILCCMLLYALNLISGTFINPSIIYLFAFSFVAISFFLILFSSSKHNILLPSYWFSHLPIYLFDLLKTKKHNILSVFYQCSHWTIDSFTKPSNWGKCLPKKSRKRNGLILTLQNLVKWLNW